MHVSCLANTGMSLSHVWCLQALFSKTGLPKTAKYANGLGPDKTIVRSRCLSECLCGACHRHMPAERHLLLHTRPAVQLPQPKLASDLAGLLLLTLWRAYFLP